jgi:hypothetical protein
MENKKISPCLTTQYREFPEMRFGTSETGSLYFDGKQYIREKGKGDTHNLTDFQSKFAFWIQAVSETYNLSAEDLFVTDDSTGSLLVEESLSLLFVAYLDSGFAVHMLERISEMLITGIVLSDTALVAMAKERLTQEDLI